MLLVYLFGQIASEETIALWAILHSRSSLIQWQALSGLHQELEQITSSNYN